MRFIYVKLLFEAEMFKKQETFPKKKNSIKKELTKLLDLLRISMQNEGEDFIVFFFQQVFNRIKETKSLSFHHFVIEIAENCELSEEITNLFRKNLQLLREKAHEKLNSIKPINENILSINTNNEQEKTNSTLNDGALFFL